MEKMETILVTGASGQLGRRLVGRLCEKQYNVRAHYRSREKAGKYCPEGVEPVYGDLNKPDWLDNAIEGADYVIHCAAWVSLRPGDYDLMHKINVDGTRAVLDSCQKAGVKRMVHISSVAAVGASRDGQTLDENTRYNLDHLKIPYFKTKRLAEEIALKSQSNELDVIVVNPSIMISMPGGEILEEKLKRIPRKLPVYFDFGLNLVLTEDVVDGIILAIKKGRGGQRYIFGGENVNTEHAFELAYKYLGLKKPAIKISAKLLYIAGIVAEFMSFIGSVFVPGWNGWRLNREIAKLAGLRFYYSSHKAIEELGYSYRSLDEILNKIFERGFQ